MEFKKVPYAKAVHGPEEVNAVLNVLNTTTQMGRYVDCFEQKISSSFEHSYGVMVNSGSSANLLAVEILDLPEKSEVITPILTFPTTVSPLLRNKLVPCFIDVEPGTYLINHEKIEKYITPNTSAILIPNLIGNMADWEYLRILADKYHLKLISDSCDTLGARLKKTNHSEGFYADIITTSFYGSHFINCAGSGGLLAVKDEFLAEKARVLRSWGRYSSKFQNIETAESVESRFNKNNNNNKNLINSDLAESYDKKFLFSAMGYNLEPSELGAAFGLEQFKKLPDFLKKRKENFEKHQDFFKTYEDILTLPKPNLDWDMAWLSYPITLKNKSNNNLENLGKLSELRNQLQQYFESHGIQTRPIFTGNILKQPGFQNIRHAGAIDFPVADEIMAGGILLGCHPALSEEMMNHIHEVFEDWVKKLKITHKENAVLA